MKAQYQQLKAELEPWRSDIVGPLRAIRRQLKARPDAQPLYEKLKSAELDAEQYQQALMWRLYNEKRSELSCGEVNELWSVLLCDLSSDAISGAEQLLRQIERCLK